MRNLITLAHGVSRLDTAISQFLEQYPGECSKAQTRKRLREICSYDKVKQRWIVAADVLAEHVRRAPSPLLRPPRTPLLLTTRHLWGGGAPPPPAKGKQSDTEALCQPPPPPSKVIGPNFPPGVEPITNQPRREVVGSSAGAGVVYPPFFGVVRVAYP